MDRRLQGRLDPSDVLQEAWLDASKRAGEYAAHPTMSFFLWLRLLTGQKLLEIHRRHLGAKLRDAGREVSLYRGALPQASSVCLAAQLLGRLTTASQAAIRAERQRQIQEALDKLEPLEVVAKLHELAERRLEGPLVGDQEGRSDAVELDGGVMLELAVGSNLPLEEPQLFGTSVDLTQHPEAGDADRDEQYDDDEEGREEFGVHGDWHPCHTPGQPVSHGARPSCRSLCKSWSSSSGAKRPPIYWTRRIPF